MKPHPVPREDRGGTICEDYEYNGCSVDGCPEGCYVWLTEHRKLEALERLLEAFVDPTTQRVHWTFRCHLGDAGYVQLSIDLDPAQLKPEVRDGILSTAARLVNWSHT